MNHKLLEGSVITFLNKVIGENFLTTSQNNVIIISFMIDPHNSVRTFKSEFDYKHNYNALRGIFINSGYILDTITYNDNATITLSFHYNQARADNDGDASDDMATSKKHEDVRLIQCVRGFFELGPEHIVKINEEGQVYINFYNQCYDSFDHIRKIKVDGLIKWMCVDNVRKDFNKMTEEICNLSCINFQILENKSEIIFTFNRYSDDTTTSKTLKSYWIEQVSYNEQLEHRIRNFLNLEQEHHITIRDENNIFIKLFSGQDFQNLEQEKTTKAIIFFRLMSDPKFHINFGRFLYDMFDLELLKIRKSQNSGVVEFNVRKAKYTEIEDESVHRLPEVIVNDSIKVDCNEGFLNDVAEKQVQRAPAKEYYEGNEGLYIKRDKKEKVIQSSNICHYLKWNITDSLSLRYYFNFEDKPEMIKQFVLKDHNTKSYNIVIDLSIAQELRKVSSNKCVEILGRKLVNKYHKVQIQFYENFSKFEIEE